MMTDLDVKPILTDFCQVLIIRMNGMLACIELANVERTFSLLAMQVMPGSASYVAGIMNYAGYSLPVIDLAIRLGLQSAAYTLDTPIMVCVHQQHRVAVLVQDIIGIELLQDQDRQLSREIAHHGAAFRASVHTGQGLALLLDVAWLTQSGLYQDAQSSDD